MGETMVGESIRYLGVDFRVISPRQAQECLHDCTDFGRKPLYNVLGDAAVFPLQQGGENAVFLLAEVDAEVDHWDTHYSVPEHPDLFIMGYIFRKNLYANTYIMACDIHTSPILAVMGDMEAMNIHLFGNIHYVRGNLRCETLWTIYNAGALYVKGELHAQLVCADGMDIQCSGTRHIKAFMGLPIQYPQTYTDEAGKTLTTMEYLLPSHALSDVVHDRFISRTSEGTAYFTALDDTVDKPENSALLCILKGGSLLDPAKRAVREYAGFVESLPAIFEEVFRGMGHNAVGERIYTPAGDCVPAAQAVALREVFSTLIENFNGEKYRSIRYYLLFGYNIEATVMNRLDTDEYLLRLVYLQKDISKTKFEWILPVRDNTQPAKMVKCAFLRTVGNFKKWSNNT